MSGVSNDIQQHLAPSKTIEKYVKSPLKGIHAYKNVSYMPVSVTIKGGYRHVGCGLCDQQLFYSSFISSDTRHVAVMDEHVRSVVHETRYLQLCNAQKAYIRDVKRNRFDRSELLRELIEKLMLPQWRWHMCGLVMQYIDTPLSEDTIGDSNILSGAIMGNDEKRKLDMALAQLAKYEQMERLSLLELAIMKSKRCNCIACVVGKNPDHDNTESKETRIIKSGAAVIIPLVVQFLGKPPPIFT